MKFIAFDVETTGTNILEDDVLQIAAIAFDDRGELRERFNAYATTEFAFIPEGAVAKHGLTKERLTVLEAKPPAFVGRAFKSFVEMYSGDAVGHNIIGFDLPLVWNWIKRNNSGNFVLPTIDSVYDTMMSARAILRTRKWLSNSELAEALGIEVDSTKLHDALYDLEITTSNFLKLRNIGSIDLNAAIERLPEILARRPAR